MFKRPIIDPKFKKEWVEALRSGEYDQGSGRLRKMDDTFCCLGVAADLCEPGSWEAYAGEYFWKGRASVLGSSTPFVRKNEQWRQEESVLVSLNDTGQSFSQIADYIEENL